MKIHSLPFIVAVALNCSWPLAATAQQRGETGPGNDAAATDQQATDGAEPEEDPNDIRVFWRDGFRLQTADGQFELNIGGRVHADTAFFADKEPFDGLFGQLDNATELRRARLHLKGHMYGRVDYMLELDFAGGQADMKDIYLGVRDLPIMLRFGHQKEPWSLEEQTSSRFITFMERSLAIAFSPERNFGVRVQKVYDGRTSWSAGVFRKTDGFAGAQGDNYNITGRVTHAPVMEDVGRRLVHLGAGYTHKFVDGVLTLQLRPDAHTAPSVIRLDIPATSADYLSFEAAGQAGALGVQGEYVQGWVKSVERDDPSLNAWYVQGSYFVTGEHRPYDGVRFGRVRPARNFLSGGPGAWELALRYARGDFSEGTESGMGELSALTAGLNWYWNPHLRIMFNYTLADLPDRDVDSTSIYQFRVSWDF